MFMQSKRTVTQILQQFQLDERMKSNIAHWETIPPREARTVPFPPELDERIRYTLANRGIHSLYTHQAASFQYVREGKHIVAVTPTASGKSMCYHLPVLQALSVDSQVRALYLFPTKALAQDQKSELHELIEGTGFPSNRKPMMGIRQPIFGR